MHYCIMDQKLATAELLQKKFFSNFFNKTFFNIGEVDIFRCNIIIEKKSDLLEIAFHSVKVLCCSRRLQYCGSGKFSRRIRKMCVVDEIYWTVVIICDAVDVISLFIPLSSSSFTDTERSGDSSSTTLSFFRSENSIGEAYVLLFIFDCSEY
ncbi:unnamed protein product [Wuchereria bancrofti]|uniref:Uncharacterized protein n=1 Tax=Wuchereria bancrofti TaxID=6293 RepID=A0A3P7FKE1_WUCBA|nr:unnamed protein product [Wuchereria bancrofti]